MGTDVMNPALLAQLSAEWREDSLRWRGRILTGQYAHWCPDWDYLTIDETCPEWPCQCGAADGWHGPVQKFFAENANNVTCLDLGVVQAIPAMTERQIDNVRQIETMAMEMPQVPIITEHVIHGGMYARTIMVPAGTMITGALIKVPTVLIVNGTCTVYIGDGAVDVNGYHVIPASAGRKQAFIAHADTWITMVVATEAKDVEAAENYFTDEVELLGSHRDVELNRIVLTGE